MSENGFYHGDLRHRPRLTFDARDGEHIARVVDRIARQEQPWADGYRYQQQVALSGKVPHSPGYEQELAKTDEWNQRYQEQVDLGTVAAARALVTWLYQAQGLNPAWSPLPLAGAPEAWVQAQIDAVISTLDQMYCEWPAALNPKVIDRGIVAADALTMHCLAFDLVAALLPEAQRPRLSNAEHRIGAMASDFYAHYDMVATLKNNHCVRIASALGIAAITVNRYSHPGPAQKRHQPARWIEDRVYAVLDPDSGSSVLQWQGGTGAWAEGTGYYAYSCDLLLPFAFAYARFLGGAGKPFLASGLLNDLLRWAIDLRMPDSRRPMIGDAVLFTDSTPAFLLSRIRGGARSEDDQAVYLWDWLRTGATESGFPDVAGRHGCFLLAAYDPSDALLARARALSAPSQPATKIMPARGQAVLRTDWSEDAGYAVVQAQSGAVRTHGTAHEIPANGSYSFYARRDLITIEPGYFGYSKVAETNRSRFHSIVLVDGKGPSAPSGFSGELVGGADTHIITGPRTVAADDLPAVEVQSSYCKAQITRSFALVGDRYLLIEDLCESDGGDKTFTSQIQTNGARGQDLRLTVTGDIVRYTTEAQKLPVCVGACATAPLTTATAFRNSHIGSGPDGHHAIEYSARGRKLVFLTAIAVDAVGRSPCVEVLSVPGALLLRVEAGGRVDVIVSNREGLAVSVPASKGTRAFTTSHALQITSFADGDAGTVLWAV